MISGTTPDSISRVMDSTQKGPKACTTCAKAKARCIPRSDGGQKCERCHRLNKDCFSRPPAPPRVKKRPKRSRVAELEKRLNELSSQFEGGNRGSASSPESSAPRRPSIAKFSDTAELDFGHLFPPRPEPSAETEAKETEAWSPEALKSLDSPWPLPSEAGVLLSQYHSVFAHLFPFVVIPKHLSSAELREQRPFLWKAVMMTSCFFDGSRQVRLGQTLIEDIGRASFVDGLKTFDLLQGLQLLVAWFHYALKSTQLTNFLFLARSMCVNLSSSGLMSPSDDPSVGQLDHLRAYAGTYYLNTLVFTTNKRTDVFMNTTHLETCCKVLETTMEYPSDQYLVRLVKIQQLAQSISLTMAFDPNMPAMSLPLTMVVQSFQEQLDTFKETLPPSLSENPTLETHICIAQTLLLDIAISDQHCNSSHMALTDRLQLLWACVRSLRGFFKVRFATRDIEKPRFLCLIASDLAYTIITGIKLLTMRLPGWNRKQIASELALGRNIDLQIEDLDMLVSRRKSGLLSAESTSVEDPLERLLLLLKNSTGFIAALIQKEQQKDEDGMAGAADIVDGLDEDFWHELMHDTAWNPNEMILLDA